MFYNKNKQGIDVSDQMNSYFTPLRKSIRWYHKVAFQLLLGTSVVQPHVEGVTYNKNKPITWLMYLGCVNFMEKQC